MKMINITSILSVTMLCIALQASAQENQVEAVSACDGLDFAMMFAINHGEPGTLLAITGDYTEETEDYCGSLHDDLANNREKIDSECVNDGSNHHSHSCKTWDGKVCTFTSSQTYLRCSERSSGDPHMCIEQQDSFSCSIPPPREPVPGQESDQF